MRPADAVVSRPRAPADLTLHWQLARKSFSRMSTYRGATVAGVFTNGVFGFLRVYVLLAVLDARPGLGGYDATDVVTYTFLMQGMLATVFSLGDTEIAERIRTGDIVSDLYRPVDFQSYWLATDLGRASFLVLFRGVPQVAIGAVAFGVRVPPDAGVWVAFAISLTLAIVVSFCMRFLVSLTAFWLLDQRGVWQLTVVTSMFLAGFAVPLSFFPGPLVDVVRRLPFAAMGQLPVDLFLGEHRSVSSIGSVLAWQLGWAVALLAAGRLLLRGAVRKVVVQGG